MRKRILALLLAVVMTVGLLPTAAFAAEGDTHDNHKVCEGADAGSHDCTEENVTWTAWNPDDAPPTESGNYYLTEGVTLSNTWEVPTDADINLCLNGHTITLDAEAESGSVITVQGTLTLCDCSEAKTGKITGGKGGVYDGKTGKKGGGGVYVDCSKSGSTVATFNMYSGSITNNTADSGGGVCVDRSQSGSAVATFNMYGGKITDGSATDTNGGGGGVYVLSGTFTMNGGEISNNSAAGSGGGVYVHNGTFTMTGGTITGNKSDRNGGGVFIYYSTFAMGGGTITGNESGGNGGGVSVDSTATFEMSGGTITGNESSGNGGGVYVRKSTSTITIKLSGSVQITENTASNATDNVYLPSDKTITIGEDGLTQGASIGVTTQTKPAEDTLVDITGTNSADYSAYFFSDKDEYGIKNGDNNKVQLAPPYIVKFVTGANDITVPEQKIFPDSENKIVNEPTDLTRPGYALDGWYTDEDCTEEKEWNFGTPVTEDVTLYAKWTPIQYTVNFDSQDGSGVKPETSVTVDHGSTVNKPTDPSWPGRTFGGWYKDAACTTAWDFDNDTVTGNMTLYARWHTLIHQDSVPATCTNEGVEEYWTCSGCKKNFSDAEGQEEIADLDAWKNGDGKIEKVSHDWEKEWTSDDTSHWHKCKNCSETTKASHSYADGSDTCGTCGYKPPDHTHTWAEDWTSDNKGHWHKCTEDCPETDNTKKGAYGVHSYGDYQNDERNHWHECICGYKTDVDAHTKTWVNTDASQHWEKCSICGWEDTTKAAHVYTDNQDTDCNTCGYKRTVTPDHTHTLTHQDSVAATCTKEGVKEYWTCSGCKKEFSDADGQKEIADLAAWKTGAGKIEKVSHVWETDWTSDDTGHWHKCTAGGCTVTDFSTVPESGYAAHVWNAGVVTKEPTAAAEGVKTYTCTTCAATRTESVPIPTFAISGNVTDSEGKPVTNVTVTLKQGSHQVAGPVTPEGGAYSFPNVKPGSYNVVAEQTEDDDDTKKTMTILVVITDGDKPGQNLTMPSDNVNSVLKVKGTSVEGAASDVSKTVVGGLEAEAEFNKVGGKTVTITMAVQATTKNETDPVIASEISKIEKAAPGKTLEFLAITVDKQVADEIGQTDADKSGSLTRTTNLLTIVIPFDFSGKAENSVVVYRYHGNAAAALDKDPAKGSEGYKLDKDNGFIIIYSKRFSTYAIGYTEAATTYTLTVIGGTGSGSYAAGEKVSISATIPIGKHFTNWTGATVDNANSASTTLTMPAENITVTANFKKDSSGNNSGNSGNNSGNSGNSGNNSGNSGNNSGSGSGSYIPTTYPVDVPGSIPNGTVSVSPKNASSGTTVTITATPVEGYKIGTVTVTDKNGREISVTDKGNGKYTFTMPAGKATVSAGFTKIGGSYAGCPRDYTCPIWPYTDASTTAWYHDGVHYCIKNGLMAGYDDHTFGPDGDTTRAMIATILWRLEGCPVVNYILPFDDVAEGVWYTEAIRWAAASGVVGGYGNGKFGPDDPITREQLAAMLYRYEQYKGGGFTGAWMFPLNYTDAESVSSWAYEPMCWTTMNGIINGIGNGLLDPNGKATRAQAAAMIMRFCERQ